MRQKTIITSKIEILVIDLPQTELFSTKESISELCDTISMLIDNGSKLKHLDKATELTEEDWRGIVDQKDKGYGVLVNKDYVKDRFTHSLFTATESGLSLLKANGVLISNPHGDEMPKTFFINRGVYLERDPEDYKLHYELWRKSESKVWRNCHVFIKKK